MFVLVVDATVNGGVVLEAPVCMGLQYVAVLSIGSVSVFICPQRHGLPCI
jgi:hypothetical protein